MTPLKGKIHACGILVGGERVNEFGPPGHRPQMLFERVHAHPLFINRHTDHLKTDAFVCVDRAAIRELLSDHLITRRIHQRLTYERYSLHGTIREGHHFRINLNAFTLTFPSCHQRTKSSVPFTTRILIEAFVL